MRRNARRPSREAARARETLLEERDDDLLERALDEIVVVTLTTTEDSIERAIDGAADAVVKYLGHAIVAAHDGIDDLVIRGRRSAFRGGLTLPARNRAKP